MMEGMTGWLTEMALPYSLGKSPRTLPTLADPAWAQPTDPTLGQMIDRLGTRDRGAGR